MKPKVLVVVANYYKSISFDLNLYASSVLNKKTKYKFISVPGVFEIPVVISKNIKKYDGFIALGCVIRGETTHYDYVCSESARALQDLSVQYLIPLGYGILTVENKEQALLRARRSGQDRGGHAARACLRMIEVKRHLNFYAE